MFVHQFKLTAFANQCKQGKCVNQLIKPNQTLSCLTYHMIIV